MSFNCSLGGEYCNPSFVEIFTSADSFVEGYRNCGIPATVSDDSVRTLFYLLYAKFGNTPIKSNDKNLFAYRCYQTIFQYAPAWEKRLEIQERLRDFSLEASSELYQGAKTIYNHALHDGSAPSTQTLTELSYIDSQNTTNYKKAKIDALAELESMLETDVTEILLNKFKPLFSQWLRADTPVYYVTENNENV